MCINYRKVKLVLELLTLHPNAGIKRRKGERVKKKEETVKKKGEIARKKKIQKSQKMKGLLYLVPQSRLTLVLEKKKLKTNSRRRP